MTTPNNPETPTAASPDAEEIEADIARTREELGRTVEELSDRLDVKSRARDKLHGYAAGARNAVCDDQGKPKPGVSVAGAVLAAAAVTAVAAMIWRRSR